MFCLLGKNKPKKVGLALGSGGARGLAHIGVIKVLEENKIPIDFIAGSSMGALVGGFYAAKKNIKEIEKIANDTDWKKIVALLDPNLKHGLLTGDKVKLFIEDYLGSIDFKELKIPLALVATDYATGEAVIMDQGRVSSAVRASASVPFAFKPVKTEKHLLVDGGLSIPVPVEQVRKMGAEIVIAVNLDGDYACDGKDLQMHKIALHSMDILRYNLAKENTKTAELVLNPKVGHVFWFDFLTGKKLIKAGEEETKKQLAKIKKLL